MVFTNSYSAVRKFCKKHKIEILEHISTRGGHRLNVMVPEDIEFTNGKLLGAGLRTLRINAVLPVKEANKDE